MSRPRSCPASSRPPTRSTSATTSARCGSGWPCRTTTTRSTASSTCTRSPSSTTRRRCAARTRDAAAQLLALGLDPDRCTLFVQCHVPEHAQLAWVLGCLTGFGEASRMTQFKDKSAKQGADAPPSGCSPTRSCRPPTSCSTRPTGSPSARTSASTSSSPATSRQRFNCRFGETLRACPSRYILTGHGQDLRPAGPDGEDEQVRLQPGRHRQPARRPEGQSAKKIRSAVTDTGREIRFDPEAKPGVSNLLTIYSALTDRKIAELEADYAGRGLRRPEEGPRRGGRGVHCAARGTGTRLSGRPGRARPDPRPRRHPGAGGLRRDAGGRPREDRVPAADG